MSHSFIIHAGAREVDFDDVSEATNDLPEPTETHYPISHQRVVEYTRDILGSYGLEITGEKHALYDAPDGAPAMRYFGQLTLRHPQGDDSWSPAIVLRNCHDKTFSLQESFGSDTVVCDNLLLTGTILAMQKHTKNGWESFKAELVKAVQIKVIQGIEVMLARNEAYRQTGICETSVDEILMESYRRKIVAPSMLGKIHDEYWSDEHNEKHGVGTVHSLINAYTEALKGRIVAYPKKSYALTNLMDEWADFRGEEEVAA